MKIVVAPDSYKGSLTAAQVGETIARALRQEIPHSEIKVIPMADGGEGTVDALVQAAGGRRSTCVLLGRSASRSIRIMELLMRMEGRPRSLRLGIYAACRWCRQGSAIR